MREEKEVEDEEDGSEEEEVVEKGDGKEEREGD